MRVPLAGGTPQLVFEIKSTGFDFDCSRLRGNGCVGSQASSDRQQHTYFNFDPVSGARHELFRITSHPGKGSNFILSPDGSRIAMVGADPKGAVEIRSLNGQVDSRIEAKGWTHPFTVDWAADGKALFVSHPGLIESPSGPIGATLLRVDLEGHVEPLWETKAGRYTWAIPSLDGKYLAIREPATERNAWMIENF